MRKQRIAQTAERLVDAGAFSGVEWLISKGGKPWSRGRAGQADAVAGMAMPENPIYRIYSMTKPIVSVAALMLMERMQLRLFDPVAAALPDFAAPTILDPDGTTRPARRPILVENLLTHRAGFSYGFLDNCPVGQRYRGLNLHDARLSLAEAVAAIAAEPIAYEPGTQWRYSAATDVLARLLEVVSGQPIGQLLDELILTPLGMTDTGYSVPEADRNRLMAMFGNDDLDRLFEFEAGPQVLTPADVSAAYPADNPAFSRGGHGLFSTLDDYMKFAQFLMTGRSPSGEQLLSRKMMEMMVINRIPASIMPLMIGPLEMPGYGYGLAGRVMINQGAALGLTSDGEHGWAGAASTYFWVDPAEDVVGVVMSQYLGSKIPIGDDIRVAAYQALDES